MIKILTGAHHHSSSSSSTRGVQGVSTLVLTLACIIAITTIPPTAASNAHVFCDRLSPLVVRECPVAYPVCCIWPNGVFTACCPPRRMCDLYSGECVAMRNRTTDNNNVSDDDLVPGVMGKPYDQGGVEVSLQFASSMVGVFFFGFLLLISMSIQYGKLIAHRREFARRQQELEARELLVANDAVMDEEEEEEAPGGADEDDDEERMCKVCFCNKMDCALVKCGHVVCCRWCAKKLAICPICREAVQHIVRLGHVESIRRAVDDSRPAGTDDASTTTGGGGGGGAGRVEAEAAANARAAAVVVSVGPAEEVRTTSGDSSARPTPNYASNPTELQQQSDSTISSSAGGTPAMLPVGSISSAQAGDASPEAASSSPASPAGSDHTVVVIGAAANTAQLRDDSS